MNKFENPSFDAEANPERPVLSGKEKIEVVLKMFGTSSAKDTFIELCKRYLHERRKSISDNHGESYKRGYDYSPPQRANIHNRIMETLSKLATQTKNITPLQRQVLNEIHNREDAARAIKEYIASVENEEDEDEHERRRQNSSDTAYFHSLGKEH